MLEDPNRTSYFILCTTDDKKLKTTIHTRCTSYKMSALNEDQLKELVKYVCKCEKFSIDEDVISSIIEMADGSPRKCLVLLEQIAAIKGTAEQIAAIDKIDQKKIAIDLCRCLINARSNWKETGEILQKIDEEPESVRRIVLGYANAVLQKSNNSRAALIISNFQFNFYDSGKAGLTLACYNVVNAK